MAWFRSLLLLISSSSIFIAFELGKQHNKFAGYRHSQNTSASQDVEVAPRVAPKPLLARCEGSEGSEGCRPSRRCRKNHSEIIPGIIPDKLHRIVSGTGCPQEEAWVERLVKADPSPDKVIVNIGCNKGHDSIVWLNRFDQHGFWSLGDWDKISQASFARAPVCPINADVARAPKQNATETPTAICVEAMPSTVQLLKQMRKTAGYDSTRYGQFQIIFGAASDQASRWDVVEFAELGAGVEVGGLGGKVLFKKTGNKIVPVPLTTVDMLVHDLNLPKVDILIIDTEGADPAVLQGAEKTLHSVRYLMFETQRQEKATHWGKTTIFEVLSMLNGYGFECYWAGRNGNLYSITSCYTAEFEKSAWGNVVCVKRDNPWFPLMELSDPNSAAWRIVVKAFV